MSDFVLSVGHGSRMRAQEHEVEVAVDGEAALAAVADTTSSSAEFRS